MIKLNLNEPMTPEVRERLATLSVKQKKIFLITACISVISAALLLLFSDFMKFTNGKESMNVPYTELFDYISNISNGVISVSKNKLEYIKFIFNFSGILYVISWLSVAFVGVSTYFLYKKDDDEKIQKIFTIALIVNIVALFLLTILANACGAEFTTRKMSMVFVSFIFLIPLTCSLVSLVVYKTYNEIQKKLKD